MTAKSASKNPSLPKKPDGLLTLTLWPWCTAWNCK